jgi:hypothetical protein
MLKCREILWTCTMLTLKRHLLLRPTNQSTDMPASLHQKKAWQVRWYIKHMSAISFDWQGSGFQNVFFQVKQLTSTTTRSCALSEKASPPKSPEQWHNQPGWYNMILCQCTQLCQQSYFWSLTTWLWDPTPLLAWIGPLRFLLVSNNEIAVTRTPFPGCTWNSGTITDHPAWNFNFTQLQKCFQTWQKHWTHCVNSELGQQPKTMVKVFNYQSVQDPLDTP